MTESRTTSYTISQKWAYLKYGAVISTIHVLRRLLPYKVFTKFVGRTPATELDADDQPVDRVAKIICQRVEYAANKLPLSVTCLDRVASARWLLRRQGITPVIHFGVKAAEPGRSGLEAAHAWLSVNREVLVGEAGHGDYIQLESFV